MPATKNLEIIAIVLVTVIGVLGLVATYAGTPTGAAYQITETRVYQPHFENDCPDPALPVPVFSRIPSRYGEVQTTFIGCYPADQPIPQSGSRFRPSRNRNTAVTSMYADHFTRRGSYQDNGLLVYARD